jgi:hypothetical protein
MAAAPLTKMVFLDFCFTYLPTLLPMWAQTAHQMCFENKE